MQPKYTIKEPETHLQRMFCLLTFKMKEYQGILMQCRTLPDKMPLEFCQPTFHHRKQRKE